MERKRRNEVEAGIRKRGMRVTPQRYVILEYLRRFPGHPSVEEISREVNRRVPLASRATVYNTVAALESAGLISAVTFEDGVTRYDANLEPHHHFVCRICGTVADVPAGRVDVRVALREDHKMEEFELTMRGICSDCRSRGGKKK